MASVLRFAEDLFGTGQLAAADARAADPASDVFDFTQPPRAFKSFAHAPFDRSMGPARDPHVKAFGD
jgi:hypothetical protein